MGPRGSSEEQAERERLARTQRLLQVEQDESFGETDASLATEVKHPAEFVLCSWWGEERQYVVNCTGALKMR